MHVLHQEVKQWWETCSMSTDVLEWKWIKIQCKSNTKGSYHPWLCSTAFWHISTLVSDNTPVTGKTRRRTHHTSVHDDISHINECLSLHKINNSLECVH